MADAKRREGRFSYADYLTWPDDERWELIEGIAYNMSPAPAPRHQHLLAALSYQFFGGLQGTPCTVYPAPFDVRLTDDRNAADDAVHTVVQPDLTVVCDSDKMDERGCVGAPDLVVEILSPSTAYKDQTAKLRLYERHGVREYWVVNPERESVQVYLLEVAGFGKPVEYRRGESVRISIAQLEIVLEQVFGS